MTDTESYIALADADAVIAARLFNEPWNAVANERREAALKAATATLNRLHWRGRPVNASQALAWPRAGVRDRDGSPVPSGAIPAPVAIATAELALHLLTLRRAPSNHQIQMEQIGSATEMYFADVRDEVPFNVRRLIAPFLAVGSGHVAELVA